MYLGDETLFAGALLLLVAAAGWFWNDSLRARERMIATTLLGAPPAVKQMLQLTKLDYLFELED